MNNNNENSALNKPAVSCSVVHCKKAPYDVALAGSNPVGSTNRVALLHQVCKTCLR